MKKRDDLEDDFEHIRDIDDLSSDLLEKQIGNEESDAKVDCVKNDSETEDVANGTKSFLLKDRVFQIATRFGLKDQVVIYDCGCACIGVAPSLEIMLSEIKLHYNQDKEEDLSSAPED